MSAAFDRDALLDAFDRIGRAAVGAGTKLQIAVYGGSALMLASNFRFATEDVDVFAKLDIRLARLVGEAISAHRRGKRLAEDWFNDGSDVSPQPAGDSVADHLEFGTFPSRWYAGGLCGFGPFGRNTCWRLN